MYKNFSLSICLISILSLVACADSRLTLFLEDYKNMPDKEDFISFSQWKKPSSPFHPYLDRNFVEGLTPDQVKQYQRAQKLQRCETIRNLEQQGFLNLYPFLRPAFERDDIPGIEQDRLIIIFNKKIARFRSLAFQFCRQQKALEKSNQDARRLRFSFSPIRTLDQPKGQEQDAMFLGWKKQSAISRRCSAIGSLISLALVDEYRSAVKVVLRLIEKPNTLTLPPDIEYYLRKLARRLGVRQSNRRSHERRLFAALSAKEKKNLDRMGIIDRWWNDTKLDCSRI